ncbi:MAG: peptidoglycan-binding protein [Acutalibacteraceae bacterium]
MAYSTVQYGSSGGDVKKLQEALNKNGYKLDVDGQFGSKTQSAVKDYQKKNGLAVDGIVGKNTWSKLTSSTTKTQSSSKNTATSGKTVKTETKRPEYTKSTALTNAENKLNNWEKNAPEKYSSKYSEEIDGILNDILNREKFSYNLNADPLYEQYREIYTRNGKKAMMDAVGEAAALTGGYGNSYAVTAGSQAYQEYLDDLNSVALDLRDRAYEQYGDEGDKLFDDVTLLRSLDGDDYEKYLDELERYYKDGEYLLEKLTSMTDAEYEQFLAEVDAWESDRDYEFKKYTDALDREEFEKEMAFKEAEAKRDQANADRNYRLSLAKASSSSSKSETSAKEKDAKDVISYPQTYKEFCAATGYAGVMTETEFYRHEDAVKKYGGYKSYLKDMYKIYK